MISSVAVTAQQISDLVSYTGLIASIASLVLAIVAIWIALHFKRESDALNKETTNLLIEIRTDAKTVSQVALPELRAYGESMRKLVIEKHYPGQPRAPVEENLVTALEKIESEIVSLRKATDISEIKRKLDDVSKDLDRSKKTAEKGAESIARKDVNIQLSFAIKKPGIGKLLRRVFHVVGSFAKAATCISSGAVCVWMNRDRTLTRTVRGTYQGHCRLSSVNQNMFM
jgi:hypothetical protein